MPICSVCGFDRLAHPPRSLTGGGSMEICPACGFQHGVSDDDAGHSHAAWRARWVREGAKWSSKQTPPAKWKPTPEKISPRDGAKFIALTGGTRGCGRALVEAFVKAGHTVAACGRSAESIAELREKFGPPHDFTALDVADAQAVERWTARLALTHGAPDIVVNGAALIARNAPLWQVPAAEIEAVLAVNIRGTVNILRGFTPAMIAAKRGVIVNFSSGWGRSTSPEVAIYCASKWAIEGLTQALAQELPPGVAAVALNPGIINTDMLRSCFGSGASAHPGPAVWAKSAAPLILNLGPRHNGKSLDV